MNDHAAYALIESNKALIHAMGMHWENEALKQNNEAPAYNEQDFSNLTHNIY